MVLVLVLVTPSQELESLFEVWTADTGACLRQHLRSLDRARAGEQPAGRLLNKLDWTEGVSGPDIMLYIFIFVFSSGRQEGDDKSLKAGLSVKMMRPAAGRYPEYFVII